MSEFHETIVAKILAAPSGGTASLVGLVLPTTGYWVGHGKLGFTAPAPAVTRPFLLDALQYIRSIRGVGHVGWWTDAGRFYIEPSTWHVDYRLAYAQAEERGELAFFDIGRGQDVRLRRAA